MRRNISRSAFAHLALAASLAAALGAALAMPAARPSNKPIQDPNLPRASEAAAHDRPEPTKAGSWEGSWYYSDRFSRMAFWFDGEKGKMKIRYRYEVKGSGDESEMAYGDTGASGTGSSAAGTGPGSITFTSKVQSDGSIRGRIVRTWPEPVHGGTIVESNDFEAWRILGGDEMFLLFHNTTRETRGGNAAPTTEPVPDQGFTLRKLTDEIVRWEELIG